MYAAASSRATVEVVGPVEQQPLGDAHELVGAPLRLAAAPPRCDSSCTASSIAPTCDAVSASLMRETTLSGCRPTILPQRRQRLLDPPAR